MDKIKVTIVGEHTPNIFIWNCKPYAVGDACSHCSKGKLVLVNGNDPHTVDHYQCALCDSTYNINDCAEELIAKIWLYPNGQITYRSFVPETTHEIVLKEAKEK